MNWEKAKKNLDKINLMWQNIRMAEGDLSPLERDLMLSYMRKLYDCFLDQTEKNHLPSVSSKSSQQPEAKVTPVSSKPDYDVDRTKATESLHQVEPVVRMPEQPKQDYFPSSNGIHRAPEHTTPVEHKQPVVLAEPAPAPQPAAVERPMPVYQAPSPVERVIPTPQPVPVETPAPSYTHSINPSQAVLRLFDVNKASDLSEKLSQLPISDLTRAFGVNERILIINELFGGDSGKFGETIRQLNGLAQFNDAKSFLVREVAMANHWADEDKAELAASFIRLIRRKYPSA